MSNTDQIAYWNGQAGEKWVRHAERLDALLEPFADEVLEIVSLIEGEHVLDVGCGAGALTLKAGFRVGDKRGAVGIDVSKPLLSLARLRASERGAPASFEEADAALYRSERPVDALISRFGVMFFDDPVTAFANLRDSLKPEGRMVFACWQALSENDWARAPLEAALPLLPAPPATPPPGTPGPFAFADKNRVASILTDAGWKGIVIHPWLGRVTLPGDTNSDAARFMMELGPVARLVSEAGAELSQVEDALAGSLAAHTDQNGRVTMPAAAWIVSAIRG
ncbi:MAG: class I SAM-dependent methyltransferase [Pseudomonadota bacterium]|nr:class I SAM-dependent methyltransferase [Pseudomonadota bacterium]